MEKAKNNIAIISLILSLTLNVIISAYFYGKLTQSVDDQSQKISKIESDVDYLRNYLLTAQKHP